MIATMIMTRGSLLSILTLCVAFATQRNATQRNAALFVIFMLMVVSLSLAFQRNHKLRIDARWSQMFAICYNWVELRDTIVERWSDDIDFRKNMVKFENMQSALMYLHPLTCACTHSPTHRRIELTDLLVHIRSLCLVCPCHCHYCPLARSLISCSGCLWGPSSKQTTGSARRAESGSQSVVSCSPGMLDTCKLIMRYTLVIRKTVCGGRGRVAFSLLAQPSAMMLPLAG
jgi:hypothetical protein